MKLALPLAHRWWLVLALAALLVRPAAAADSAEAGRIELVEGQVTLADAAKRARTAAVGEPVREGDTITTARDAEVHIKMEDGGFIAVRPNTQFRIVKYRAQGDEQDTSIVSLLRGSIRSVTGWIGRYTPQAYRVRTPTATIGVRGTDHEPLVIPQGSAEGEPGTYDKVNAGGSFIEGRHGRVEVAPKQVGFASLRLAVAPKLLAEIPRFFKATKHEAALDRLHEQLRPLLEKKREDRRKFETERKVELEKRKAGRQTEQDRRKAELEKRKIDRKTELEKRKAERKTEQDRLKAQRRDELERRDTERKRELDERRNRRLQDERRRADERREAQDRRIERERREDLRRRDSDRPTDRPQPRRRIEEDERGNHRPGKGNGPRE